MKERFFGGFSPIGTFIDPYFFCRHGEENNNKKNVSICTRTEMKRQNESLAAADHKKLQPSPILLLDYDETKDFLQSKVKEQVNATWTVADKLFQMRDKRSYGFDCPSNLFKMVFTGTTGCGKTEMVRWIKYLLGMDTDFEYARQYVEVIKQQKEDVGESSTTTATTTTTTMSSHTVYADMDALVDKLNEALYTYDDNNANGKRKCVSPRFILLVIDEVDTLDNAFLYNIGPLLSTGSLTKKTNSDSNARTSFLLPSETSLMILFTCSYGEEGIRQMSNKSDDTARLHIVTDMIKRDMNQSMVEGMGLLVPFYPLKIETLRMILMERLEQFIKESFVCKQFGEITYDGDVKNMLIEKVLNFTQQRRGIRQGLGKLLEKIGDFFDKALRELHKKQIVCKNAKSQLIVRLHEIDVKKFDEQIEQECQQFINEVMRSILNDPRSVDTMTEYRAKEKKIDALSMYMKDGHVYSSDIQLDYNVHQNNLFNKCYGTSPLQVVLLKEKNQALADTLDKVESLVNKNKDDPLFHQKVKAIVVKSKKRLGRYDLDLPLALTDRVHGDDDDETPTADESGEASESPFMSVSTTSSFEEEKQQPTVVERVLAKYGDKKYDQLEELTMSSEVDQDSEEDKRLELERRERNDACMKRKLLKKDTHKMITCQGECGLSKNAITSFNPRLYKSRTEKPSTISYRTFCNMCRKK